MGKMTQLLGQYQNFYGNTGQYVGNLFVKLPEFFVGKIYSEISHQLNSAGNVISSLEKFHKIACI